MSEQLYKAPAGAPFDGSDKARGIIERRVAGIGVSEEA